MCLMTESESSFTYQGIRPNLQICTPEDSRKARAVERKMEARFRVPSMPLERD